MGVQQLGLGVRKRRWVRGSVNPLKNARYGKRIMDHPVDSRDASSATGELPVGLTLEPDYITIPGQSFALVSFVGPSCPQKNEKLGMKIRGVFATKEDASAHVKRIQRSGDNIVDIYLLDLYQWAVIPPDPKDIEDHEFQEKFLQDMMSGYAESQRAAKTQFDDRKNLVMTEGLDKHLLPAERIAPPTREDIAALTPDGKLPELTADAVEQTPPSASQIFEELDK